MRLAHCYNVWKTDPRNMSIHRCILKRRCVGLDASTKFANKDPVSIVCQRISADKGGRRCFTIGHTDMYAFEIIDVDEATKQSCLELDAKFVPEHGLNEKKAVSVPFMSSVATAIEQETVLVGEPRNNGVLTPAENSHVTVPVGDPGIDGVDATNQYCMDLIKFFQGRLMTDESDMGRRLYNSFFGKDAINPMDHVPIFVEFVLKGDITKPADDDEVQSSLRSKLASLLISKP
jgi:hypothetical protein